METVIAVAVVVLIVALAAGYVIKVKKRGQKCIGCPQAKNCGKYNCTCGCGEQKET